MRSLPLLLSFQASLLLGQTITGSLTGTIRDASGHVVPDAAVSLQNEATGARMEARSDNSGLVVFPALQPATYNIRVSKAGFKRLERPGVVVTAGERRAVSDLVLEVGQVTETVTVTDQAAAIQTVSAERSGLVTGDQIVDLMLIGRDYLDLLKTLPGVADFSSHEAPAGFNFNMAVQGNRPGTNLLTLDGVTNLNSGSGSGTWLSPSVDSIAEVKVLLNNYQAEYGRNSGASVNVITKGGSRDFHGSGYYFKRNEALNANDFFFNSRGVKRPRYRYDFGGFNIGGPVALPGKFNSNRDKLFFFFAEELMPQSFPNAQSLITTPTDLERRGDFSQTLDQNGRLIAIRDPDADAPFAGNVIPASRVNPSLQKLLGVLPAPNFTDPARSFNHVTSDTYEQPRYETLFRIDYRVNDNHSLYFRGVIDTQDQRAGYGAPAQGGNWTLIPSSYKVDSKGALVSMQNTLSPTLIHQFTGGITRAIEQITPLSQQALERVQRNKIGLSLPQFNPQVNDLDLIPNATFGGVPNAASIVFESRYPFFGANNIWDFTDSVSKIQGAHTLKAGIFVERVQRAAKRASIFNGAFDFGRDVNNPLDTNWAYSNALLGVFRSYTESDQRPWGNMRFFNIEWYAQDTWKATRKLTLDYGMRFAIIQPQYERDGRASAFNPDFFDASRAGVLVRPVRNAAGARVGQNPLTGELLPSALIGSLVRGSSANGMVVARDNPSYPRGLADDRGVHYGPRFGFAYDPFGNGKTAIRGGFGITYNREDSSIVLPFTENPPLQFTPTSFFGRASELLSLGRVAFPSSVEGIHRTGEVPTVMSYSLGIQRDLGRGTSLDVAYASTLGRHLRQLVNLNGIAPGANFLAANQDPGAPGRPLPPDFLRPYQGLGNINYRTYDATSNYHSLQMQVHRRFTKGFQISGVWTWSKTMSTSDGGVVSLFLDQRSRNYGRAGYDRTHIVNVNWIYDLPRASTVWNNPLSRSVLDGWQFTGIASFISGAPLGVGFTTTDAADITGSPTEAPRPDRVGRAEIARGERSVTRYFSTGAFARPARGTVGNSAKDVLRGPGLNNFDMGLYKNFRIRERVRFQLRWETYNTFNHTQFAALDTTARFDPAGLQVNGRFGQAVVARTPRRMQLALKLNF